MGNKGGLICSSEQRYSADRQIHLRRYKLSLLTSVYTNRSGDIVLGVLRTAAWKDPFAGHDWQTGHLYSVDTHKNSTGDTRLTRGSLLINIEVGCYV